MAKLILYQTKSPYEGDVTKNCQMTGKEMDSNFLNLKGDDIKTIVLDDKTNILTVTRNKDGFRDCNGEVINAKYRIDLNKLGFISDIKAENGMLIGKKSDGTNVSVRLSDISILCSTDGTIDGNGSAAHPLSISRGSRTGQYSACKEIIDVIEGEKLPENPSLGERYITREEINKSGKLYPYDAVWKIAKDLEAANYGWRIPTKKDWDDTLMLLEGCKDLPKGYKNHHSEETGNLGRYAGKLAKTVDTWKEYELNKDNFGFMGIYAVGYKDAAGNWSAGSDNHASGMSTAFWTSTLREGDKIDDDGYKVYAKRFDAFKKLSTGKVECDTVRQDVLPQISKLSLRLVKDYDGTNFRSSEDIFGTYYPCEIVDAKTDDEEVNNELNEYYKPRIWTSINLSYSTEKIENEIEDAPKVGESDIRFFINDWDGTRWVRQELILGDSVVLTEEFVDESGNTQVHEFRMLPDEEGNISLVDLTEAGSSETAKLEEEIEAISAVTGNIVSSIGGNEDGTIEPFENEIIASAETIVDAVTAIADEVVAQGTRMNTINESAGFGPDGEYIPASGITEDAENIAEAVQILSDAISGGAGTTGKIIESVGLNDDGTMPEVEGEYLDSPETVIDALKALDEAIKAGREESSAKTEAIIESVGLDENGHYVATTDKFTSAATKVTEAIGLLNNQAVSNQDETDSIETAVGLDENGDYVKKTTGHFINEANSIEEEIAALDEQIHDDDKELENVEASVGLKVGKGDLPDEYASTNVISNGMTVIEAVESIDKKIGTPSDVRLEGQKDDEISLYAYINESDYGEF